MNCYLKVDPWRIIEEGFNPENQESSESIFSLGNGHIGQRANFEEEYTGESLQGSYVAGIYYPDKTKVGWWKNGYPEYFAKVLNAVNFIGIKIEIDGTSLDLAKCPVKEFRRVLDMQAGTLSREFIAEVKPGKQISAKAVRFLSMAMPETAAIKYVLSPLNADVEVKFSAFLDAHVKNRDANWDEAFWKQISHEAGNDEGYVISQTRKTNFMVSAGMHVCHSIDGKLFSGTYRSSGREGYVEVSDKVLVRKGSSLEIVKYIAVLSSLNHRPKDIVEQTREFIKTSKNQGFDELLADHRNAWTKIWDHSDIVIEGDDKAQQGIRFNIFHLNQTYTGRDERLNIGPKGFTGEKYGGASYWDTEAYCLPFYLCTAPPSVSKNLLLYRYRHLYKAIENAQKLGFDKGAALYPMVTMNGEECHNEWEITFEEIHRNGAIAFAIYNYIRHTGEKFYLAEAGLEVLIAISRFWSQRVNFSKEKKQYVILGVTGPNEYENNVNNNWYTNTIAKWCLEYTIESLCYVESNFPHRYQEIVTITGFDKNKETAVWEDIISRIYLPQIESEGVFEQQDGYTDKEQLRVDELNPLHRPLNQNWSWDRILRSCFIKQADVLQGIYFFEENYDTETIRRNFDYYESRTVHESSLSPCVHAILAAKLGLMDKAYELYLRTSRLDLDDYNNEVHEGLHITSMAGSYMAIIEGFAGKRIINDKLALNPQLPGGWDKFSFKILFRGIQLKVIVNQNSVQIYNESVSDFEIMLRNQIIRLKAQSSITA